MITANYITSVSYPCDYTFLLCIFCPVTSNYHIGLLVYIYLHLSSLVNYKESGATFSYFKALQDLFLVFF